MKNDIKTFFMAIGSLGVLLIPLYTIFFENPTEVQKYALLNGIGLLILFFYVKFIVEPKISKSKSVKKTRRRQKSKYKLFV